MLLFLFTFNCNFVHRNGVKAETIDEFPNKILKQKPIVFNLIEVKYL